MPYDGSTNNLAKLIRWDDLTRNADLIEAKHLFFIMDACYGGLAITRHLSPGATRFLKDMLLRHTRQVLTAGKADEQVSDAGGPLPEHSVFTGHLLEALQGKGADSAGIITANGVMAYVYQMVARDRDSHQTPHFGYLDGDGDFIFSAPQLTTLQKAEQEDEDLLISIPAVLTQNNTEKHMTVIEQTKELLSDERHRIELNDLVSKQIREVLSRTADDNFPVTSEWSPDQLIQRLGAYESALSELSNVQALVAYWGTTIHREILTLPIRRLSSRLGATSGKVVWIGLRWYPNLFLMYKCGIAALAAGNHANLKTIFDTRISDPDRYKQETTAILAITSGISETVDNFKHIPGRERNYTPRSEHLFKVLQPDLDDLFFLSTDYETLFDRFELLYALEYAHQSKIAWGPVGRFGWKHRRGSGSPFNQLVNEASTQGNKWDLLNAGFFGGSIERFQEISKQYSDNILNRLGWY
ncbi:MAG: caspase family protein [Ignavibacteriae bacterium]|nr:caspase family protein [Ignavibacteriota bacterium]